MKKKLIVVIGILVALFVYKQRDPKIKNFTPLPLQDLEESNDIINAALDMEKDRQGQPLSGQEFANGIELLNFELHFKDGFFGNMHFTRVFDENKEQVFQINQQGTVFIGAIYENPNPGLMKKKIDLRVLKQALSLIGQSDPFQALIQSKPEVCSLNYTGLVDFPPKDIGGEKIYVIQDDQLVPWNQITDFKSSIAQSFMVIAGQDHMVVYYPEK